MTALETLDTFRSPPKSPEYADLTPGQQRAIVALLSHTNIREAAAAAGLNEDTLHRYMHDDAFSRVYREQRALVLQQATAALLSLTSEAVQVFRDAMSADNEDLKTRLQGARAAFDYVLKASEHERRVRELDEIETRLGELEQALEGRY